MNEKTSHPNMGGEFITCPAPLDMRRPGSPVIIRAGLVVQVPGGSFPLQEDAQGIYTGHAEHLGALVAWEEDVVRLGSQPLMMDLTDETGEQHAVSWCAEHFGLQRRGAHLVWSPQDGWTLSSDGKSVAPLHDSVRQLFGSDKRQGRLLFLAFLVENILIERGEK